MLRIRRPRVQMVLLGLFLLVATGMLACRQDAVGQAPAPDQARTAAMEGFHTPQAVFGEFYSPVDAAVEAAAPSYDLPLDVGSVCNIEQVPQWFRTEAVEASLRANGFAVIDRGRSEDILEVYEQADELPLPVYVTVDTLLHLYHLQFDQTLKGIEEREFSPAMAEFSRKMLDGSLALYEGTAAGEETEAIREAARRNVGYFAVALKCLDPQADVPALVRDPVQAELELMEAHAGFSRSPLFVYDEDYSQYLPRGHYTRSEALQRYFKALMWYGRICMLLKGDSTGGLIPDEDAHIQTIQACLIASALHEPANADLLQTWERVYTVTAFYVGFADDLTPAEYQTALKKVGAAAGNWVEAFGPEGMEKLKSELAALRAPRIFGGTGQPILMPPFTPEQLDEILTATQGMRLMGQRFIPDGYMMQELGFPRAGEFTGEGEPFSLGQTQGGPQRVFPRGLDVMAVLGSQRAYDILKAEGDTAYADYDKQLGALKTEFGGLSATEWNANLYYSWLYSLQALLEDFGAGYPAVMASEAYKSRLLWATLASWAQLRHDTILYAKQPYMPLAGAMPPGAEPLPPPPGYVEAVPEFYGRMLALARMTRSGLEHYQVLDDPGRERLTALEEIIENLLRISRTELRGEPISREDADYIKWIGSRIKRCIEGIDEEEHKTTIVADVLTDTNSGLCVEEGVGYVKTMLAAYKLPDGRIAIGMGPVLSTYEFKHPISDRLTDEKWREEILPVKPPAAPEWVRSFYKGE